MHFFGADPRQTVMESIAVVYELTKKNQGMLFADWAQYYKAFFVPSQEPASLCTDVPPPLGKIGRGDVCESPKIIVFPFPRNVGDNL